MGVGYSSTWGQVSGAGGCVVAPQDLPDAWACACSLAGWGVLEAVRLVRWGVGGVGYGGPGGRSVGQTGMWWHCETYCAVGQGGGVP
jgi:hypothetical protein